MNFNMCIDKMNNWYEYVHGGCDDATCSMAEAHSQELTDYAAELLVSAIGFHGAADGDGLTIDARDAYNLLTTKYKKRYKKLIDKQWEELLKVSHYECTECYVVTWQPEFVGDCCAECGHLIKKAV